MLYFLGTRTLVHSFVLAICISPPLCQPSCSCNKKQSERKILFTTGNGFLYSFKMRKLNQSRNCVTQVANRK